MIGLDGEFDGDTASTDLMTGEQVVAGYADELRGYLASKSESETTLTAVISPRKSCGKTCVRARVCVCVCVCSACNIDKHR